MSPHVPAPAQELFFVLWHGAPWNGAAAAGLHGPFSYADAHAVLTYAPAGARVVAASAGSDYFQFASALALAARDTPDQERVEVLERAGIRHPGLKDEDDDVFVAALHYVLGPLVAVDPATVAGALVAAGFRARPS